MARLNLYKDGKIAASFDANKSSPTVSMLLQQCTKPVRRLRDNQPINCLEVVTGFDLGNEDRDIIVLANVGDIFHLE